MVWRLFSLLLPALFPSWRFFKEIGASPRILVEGPGGWCDALPRPKALTLWQRGRSLFWNADWNEWLFLHSLAERLAAEPSARTEALLRARLAARLGRPNVHFRIVLVWLDGATRQQELVFDSRHAA